MVFKKFKEDIVEPYPKSKIVITFYYTLKLLIWRILEILEMTTFDNIFKANIFNIIELDWYICA